MTSKTKLFLAKLLIVLSVVLIVLGTVLQFNNDTVLHPVDDVIVLANLNEDIISITTVDSDEEITPIVGNESTVNNTPIVIPPIDDGNNDSVENNDDSVDDGLPSVEEANNMLRLQIEDMYGVTVKYGNETSGYSVGGMSTVVISDAATCQAALTNLNYELSLYPTGFFKEIESKGYPLTFYLIKRYSTANVTGVTDSSYNNIVISIATDYDFADTFHHEVYHYVEKYIFSTGFRFTSWSTLNPNDFSYGIVDANYSYARTFSSDAYFVNSYAQTDEYEDRASTFEYMMKPSKASCLNNGENVWLKARTMSEQIDYFLSTVSPDVTEYWERYVYG